MSQLTPQQIQQIVEQLQIGMQCYLHIKTGEIIFVPDEDRIDYVKPWEELYKKIENSYSYREIERPGSRDQFIFMEDFVLDLPDGKRKSELLDILDDEKPFRNFKKYIEQSEIRNDWFAFNNQKLTEWVIEEVRSILERVQDER
ncbi:hypothetical protein GR160_09065 [Flavobacterium sp. Sd200]|uniref:UPF0158 family protein n=1 Tax=Flavobacterium sp. Sd200 TaxID=2692211 RepID=UPI00136B2EFE|nr:UPF0158 family protein [Flavobacterium sp. Sd200]MXN91378.1 hypothetical protein [Flavobacterium sp. Sd200]